MLRAILLHVIMVGVINIAECHYDKWQGAEHHYAKYHYGMGTYAK
jgi:hypothetical protein